MSNNHLVRAKYRAKPIHPCDNGRENQSMSIANKKKYVPPPIADDRSQQAKYDQIIWYAPHTQKKRSETIMKSKELAYRRQFQPSFNEKIVEHSKYMKQKLKHERGVQLLAEAKMQYEAGLKENQIGSVVEQSGVAGLSDGVVEIAKRRTSIQEKLDLEEAEMAEFDDEAFQVEANNIKEKKLIFNRQPHKFHAAVSKWSRRGLAFRLATGMYVEPNVKLRSMLSGQYQVIDHSISEILPWLYIGKVETAQNESFLTTHRFTHVLNVTENYPNFWPNQFVYMKVPINDDTDTDAKKYFDQVADFIKRVEDVKGKLFVHCVSGVSRAPTMVMAWMIKCKKLSLWDVYQYLQARRSLVFPNYWFKFQLTMYEIDLGFGSSVKQREEFACYEFHSLQVKSLVFRRSTKGLFATTLDLYRKPKYVSNLNL